jgi:hypothetical protein
MQVVAPTITVAILIPLQSLLKLLAEATPAEVAVPVAPVAETTKTNKIMAMTVGLALIMVETAAALETAAKKLHYHQPNSSQSFGERQTTYMYLILGGAHLLPQYPKICI